MSDITISSTGSILIGFVLGAVVTLLVKHYQTLKGEIELLKLEKGLDTMLENDKLLFESDNLGYIEALESEPPKKRKKTTTKKKAKK